MTAAPAHLSEPRTALEQARAQMMLALVEALNGSSIPYCLLSGHHHFPDAGASDVDFMVGPKDAGWVTHILRATAHRSGAMLVQAIQHETEAWYFVLAKPVHGGVAYLHPDCTTDYRRDGRLWLKADELLSRRRKCESFFVPAIADEFVYYLIKKVLKQGVSREEWQRLRSLYVEHPEECCKLMGRFWHKGTVLAIASAVVRDDITWMRSHLSSLRVELEESVPVEAWNSGVAQRARECRRWVDRAMHPTGLTITIAGGSPAQRSEFATALERVLRPAFRRTRQVEARGGRFAPGEWLARVRSTLVIRTQDERAAGSGPGGSIWVDLSGFPPPDINGVTQAALKFMEARLQERRKFGLEAMSQMPFGQSSGTHRG